MDSNSPAKEELKFQISEAYARVVYTYTSHLKQTKRLESCHKVIKFTQIILSALSTVGIIGAVTTDIYLMNVFSGLFSFALLAINLYFKEFNVADEINDHRNAADELWLIKEKYLSLLTDLSYLSEREIMHERDNLRDCTYKIYKKSPKTDSWAYSEAQKALKISEEQYFTQEELNKLLPEHLRSNK